MGLMTVKILFLFYMHTNLGTRLVCTHTHTHRLVCIYVCVVCRDGSVPSLHAH